MIKKDKVGGSITARKKELIEKWIKPYSWGKVDENSGVVKTMASKYDLGTVTVAGLFNEHASKSTKKFAVGGEVGNQVNFRGDYGKKRSGIITGKKNGGYTVATDDGNVFVESYEIDGFEEAPVAKKKRFGFFEGGGSIEEYKQAERDYDKYGEYLEDAIEDENEADIKKYKKLMDEAETKMHRYERKYEGGGEIQSKIDKLNKVVNSKMLPESAKAKARAEIERLEKQLYADSELKKSETYHLEGKDKYGNPFYQWQNISFEGDEDVFAYSTPKGTVIYGEDVSGEKDFITSFTTDPYYLEDAPEEDYSFSTLQESKIKAFELLRTKKLGRASKDLHESKENKAEEKAEHSDKIKMYISEFPKGLTEGVEDFIKEHKLSEDEVLKMLMGYKQGQILSTTMSHVVSKTLNQESKAKSVKEVLTFVKSDKAFSYKKPAYKLGDEYSVDFDYKGLLEYSLKVDENTPIKDLEKLHSSFEDNNYHTLGSPLWDAYIDLKQGNKDKSRLNILKFRKGIEEELTDEFGWKKPTSDKIELRKITQEEWNTKKKHDYASIKDGQKYILTNENGATILVPVEIIKTPIKQKFKIGDYVKILGSYGMTDYGKITAYTEGSHFESHNGYQVTGFGDPLKENQIEKVTKAEYDKATAKKEEPKSKHEGFKVMSNQYLKQGKGATYYYVVNENGDIINKETKKVYRGKELTKYWFNTKEQAQKFANELNEKAPKKPKFKVGEFVLVNYGEERGKKGKITKAYSDEIPYYEIEGASKEIPESNLELFFHEAKKPKPDHKKLLAKIKAKKTVTPSNAPSKGHKRSESSDKKRDALPLGKRVSASGNVYWENRLNRADISKEDKFEEGGEIGKNSSGWGLKFLNW